MLFFCWPGLFTFGVSLVTESEAKRVRSELLFTFGVSLVTEDLSLVTEGEEKRASPSVMRAPRSASEKRALHHR